ncbi:alpha/beta fold hydrolase [soil metagenome]
MDEVGGVEIDEHRLTVGAGAAGSGQGGVELAYLAAGPEDGSLALCLHGFPDSAWTWRHLVPELAGAGFRVVAPFLRGYAPSAVPADGRYQTGALAADAVALHEALGADGSAVIVGHDWGATATYGAAAWAPDRWRRVVAAAVPPNLGANLFSYDQLKRSFYMFVFQHPLAELIVGSDDLAFVDRLWEDWSPGYDAAEDLALLKPSLRDPANLAAAIGYYRAALGTVAPDPALAEVQAAASQPPPQPTLYLHGADDGCVGVALTYGTEAALSAPGSRVEIVPGAGHFLHLERPDVVNPLIVAFLTTGA